jgi:hypothetical protein
MSIARVFPVLPLIIDPLLSGRDSVDEPRRLEAA